MVKAIETVYKGCRFRSRLEARWAVFFDSLGIRWEFEKEGFDLGEAGWYLPDFWLPDLNIWCEIKPDRESEDGFLQAYRLSAGLKTGALLIRGSLGTDESMPDYYPLPSFDMHLFAGEYYDTYGVEPIFYGDFGPTWSAYRWESLRQFLVEKVAEGYLSAEETAIMVPALDEETRRKHLGKLDMLYFERKYHKPHYKYRWGRYEEVGLESGLRGVWTLAPVGPTDMRDTKIVNAMNNARGARFEFGEQGARRKGPPQSGP